MKHFFESHDPTQINRQGNDIGTQYRSTILFVNDSQKNLAEELINKYQILLNEGGYGKIKTKLEQLDNFYLADNIDFLEETSEDIFKSGFKLITKLNKKEVVVVPKKQIKQGFFEKLFHFFS